MFAGAEIDWAVFLGGVGHRSEAGALVRSVAEGLAFAFAAGAPVVSFARFNGEGDGGGLGDFGCVHDLLFIIHETVGKKKKRKWKWSPPHS